MVPVDDCAHISWEANLIDAIVALEEAQERLPEGRACWTILVTDDRRRIVGKLGRQSLVNAIGVNYNILRDREKLDRFGVSSDSISSMMGHYSFFQQTLMNLCRRARSIKARDVMHPVSESIDQNASLQEAIHRFGRWQTLSILVTSGAEVVGILRLPEVFQEISKQVLASLDDCD